MAKVIYKSQIIKEERQGTTWPPKIYEVTLKVFVSTYSYSPFRSIRKGRKKESIAQNTHYKIGMSTSELCVLKELTPTRDL